MFLGAIGRGLAAVGTLLAVGCAALVGVDELRDAPSTGEGGAGVGGQGDGGGTTSTGTTGTDTDTTTTTTGTTTGTTGTTTGTCQVGSPCGGDGDCCNDCLRCDEGQCVAKVGEPGSCPPCQACDGAGSCAIAQGMACGGEGLQCSDLVWGLADSGNKKVCHALAAHTVTPKCNAAGQCIPPSPADCPQDMGNAVAGCSTSCLKETSPCIPGAPAAAVTTGALCYTKQVTANCDTYCSNGTGSNLNFRQCDATGKCVTTGGESCGNYKCETSPPKCKTSCVNASFDCALLLICEGGVCK